MTEPQEREDHAIKNVIASLLEDGGPGQEPAQLPKAAVEQLRQIVDAYAATPTPELVDVVETMLLVATVLEQQQKSPTCAGTLCDLVERENVINALKQLNRQKDAMRAEEVAKTADNFSAFTGDDSKKKAPKADEAAPKGSIKLGNLDFPKKL